MMVGTWPGEVGMSHTMPCGRMIQRAKCLDRLGMLVVMRHHFYNRVYQLSDDIIHLSLASKGMETNEHDFGMFLEYSGVVPKHRNIIYSTCLIGNTCI